MKLFKPSVLLTIIDNIAGNVKDLTDELSIYFVTKYFEPILLYLTTVQ